MKNRFAFTMIELLVSVTLVSILSAVGLNVLKASTQQNRAYNAVKMSNLGKVIEGMNSIYLAEGSYPNTSSDPIVSNYIKGWPGPNYTYVKTTQGFMVYVVLSGSTTRIYKYATGWEGIKECDRNDTLVTNPTACN